MTIDTALMDNPNEPEPYMPYNITDYDDAENSASVVLLTIGILGIVVLNFGFRFYQAFCSRVRGRQERPQSTRENLTTRIVDVSFPNQVEMRGMCPICLDPMEPSEIDTPEDAEQGECNRVAIKLSCGHVFHMECLQEWLKKNLTCPICRVTI